MRPTLNPPLHSQIRRLRWAIPLALILSAGVHGLVVPLWSAALSPAQTAALEWLVYGAVVGLVSWAGLSAAADHFSRQAATEARLRAAYVELDAAHRQLLASYNLRRQAETALTEQTVLELAAQAPLRLVDATASTIVTFDDATNRLKLDVAWGLSASYVTALRAQIDAGIDATRCRECIQRGGVSQADCPLFTDLQSLAQSEGIASAICSPIVHQGERVGAMMAYFPTTDIPTASNLRVLNAFQASVAPLFAGRHERPSYPPVPLGPVDGARRGDERHDELRHFAVVEERYRLAREVHDGLAQTLAFLNLQTDRLSALLARGRTEDAARELDEMRAAIRDAYIDAREAIDGLRISLSTPADLGVYVEQFGRQTGLQATFTVEPASLTVPPASLAQLLRITQEALTNVRKHAQAGSVEVRLVENAGALELTITDDGIGFPLARQTEGVYQRHGLSTMRERAHTLGATLAITAAPGQGTRIIVTLPGPTGPYTGMIDDPHPASR